MHGRLGQQRIVDPRTIVHACEHKSMCACTEHIMVGDVLIAINYY